MNFTSLLRTSCLAAIVLLFFHGAGCRPRGVVVHYISGTVTVNGQPLVKAHIDFIPLVEGVGEPAGGYTDEKGVFRISSLRGEPQAGAMEGEYKVVVEEPKPYPTPANFKSLISPDYANPEKTPLRANVQRGKNQFDFKL